MKNRDKNRKNIGLCMMDLTHPNFCTSEQCQQCSKTCFASIHTGCWVERDSPGCKNPQIDQEGRAASHPHFYVSMWLKPLKRDHLDLSSTYPRNRELEYFDYPLSRSWIKVGGSGTVNRRSCQIVEGEVSKFKLDKQDLYDYPANSGNFKQHMYSRLGWAKGLTVMSQK